MKKIKKLELDFQRKTITELNNNHLKSLNGGGTGSAANYSSRCPE